MINKQIREIIKQLQLLAPEREVLVLADNETHFLRRVNEETNQERPHHSLIAIVVDGVKEVVFQQWEREVKRQICKDKDNTVFMEKKNKVRLVLHDDDENDNINVDVQLTDIQNIMKELKKGTFQMIDLIVGNDFEHDSGTYDPLDSVKTKSLSTTLTALHKQRLYIYHQSESWRALVHGVNFRSLYGYEYSRSCAIIMKNMFKESKNTLTAEQQSYVRLLNERVFRCEKIEYEWKDLKQHGANYHINSNDLSTNEIKSMHAEYFPMIISGCKENCQLMGNLRFCDESVVFALTTFIKEKRREAIDQYLELSMDHIGDSIRLKKSIVESHDGDRKSLKELFHRLNSNMDDNSYLNMDINKVAMVARTGSYLYNLNTSRSDEDYTIIYFHEIEEKFHPNTKTKNHFKKTVDRPFGSDKAGEIEYHGLEMMTFLSHCCKGDPASIDLLFIDPRHLFFCSKEFLELRKLRSIFLVKHCAKKYFGAILSELKKARKILEKYDDDSIWRISDQTSFVKHLYLAFFRMFELKRFLLGEDPIVRLDTNSDERKYIMIIREMCKKGNNDDFDSWNESYFCPSLVFKEAQSLLIELENISPVLQRPSKVDLNLLSLELEKIYCQRKSLCEEDSIDVCV